MAGSIDPRRESRWVSDRGFAASGMTMLDARES